ncbi:benzoate 4-monooxygenase cytochrome-like protein P450 [Podospora didyma]|uniref:Cytochrome P450 monooxygenase ABA1 n=1 Tax=Podospora didyma TaxID=330526 RepID=A0AAE0K2H8_9PEZI|nr:benzoate 4-monooxygenase cytochrome-like protein P450 [Podospora didyma]
MGLAANVSSSQLLLLAAGSFVAYYVAITITTYFRLRKFKGPFSTGVSSLWHVRAFLGLQPHVRYKEVCDKYGPIARLGPNDLVTSSAELLAHMSAVRSPYTRGPWYYLGGRVRPGIDSCFSQLNEEKHTLRRQQMAPGYSGKENLHLESSMDERVAEFMSLIRSKYLSTDAHARPFNLTHKIEYFVLDVISAIGYGEPFGDLRTDSDVYDYAKASAEGFMLVTWYIALGLAVPFAKMPLLFKMVGPSEKDKGGLGRVLANARTILDARLKRGDMDQRSDMLSSFYRHGIRGEDLLTETHLQILAGSDTTASALRIILLHLFTNPRVYAKLQAEVDKAVRDGLAPPAPDVIQDTELRKLPYLQAVIKEGMRVYPPVTNASPKQVPEGGETVLVDGQPVFLPGGVNISVSIFSVVHDKEVFGDDATTFRPERWLVEKDEAKLARMARSQDLIFGHGKYQCLGKGIANMELGKVIFELLRNFDWCIAKPEQPWRSFNYIGLFEHKDFEVLATERLHTTV